MTDKHQMTVGIYPGSFDPTTNGHLDLIIRASSLVDHLVVGVLNNSMKTPLFTIEERVQMLEELTKDMENVSVEAFSGLLVDFMSQKKAYVIIRGLRAISDYDYELQLAQTNYSLNNDIETIFLCTKNEYSFLSSSIVKEVARYGGKVSHLVPQVSVNALLDKFDNNKG